MADPQWAGAGREDLADLAWMVDCAVTFGDRGRAAELAERLLEELSRHYRAMRPLRLRCVPHVGAALADETFALIGDIEQLATAPPAVAGRVDDGRVAVSDPGVRGCPPEGFRARVERLVAHEAAEMTTLGQHF